MGVQSPEEPLSAVDVFAPWSGPEERALRIRVHKARDKALAKATRSNHSRARVAYWIAEQLASAWVFAHGATTEDLNEILEALSHLFLAAGKIERLEAPDA